MRIVFIRGVEAAAFQHPSVYRSDPAHRRPPTFYPSISPKKDKEEICDSSHRLSQNSAIISSSSIKSVLYGQSIVQGKDAANVNSETWSIEQTLAALSDKTCSTEELIRTTFDRIQTLNPKLKAFISVNPDYALAKAREVDSRRSAKLPLGPLAGVPIAVKDLYDTDFAPTTYGGLHYQHHRPSASAEAVRRLEQAGAIVVGKTNLHEYAYGTTSENPHYGTVLNPWNRAKIAGGSSGGSSAAVVAGMCTAAIGTDTGGSVRIPAALTGHVGLKPTFGLISSAGVFPLAPTLDCVGPMTKTVADAALMLDVMAGYDPKDPHSVRVPVRKYQVSAFTGTAKVGVAKHFFFDRCHASVLQVVQSALSQLEADPRFNLDEVSVAGIDRVPEHQSAIITSEAFVVHQKLFQEQPHLYGPDVRERLAGANSVKGYEYIAADAFRRQFQKNLQALFAEYDVIITPTTPLTATDVGQTKAHIRAHEVFVRGHLNRYTNPWNFSGLPAITIPCGLSAEGLPVGLQLISWKFSEQKLLTIAKAVEEVISWEAAVPDLN